MNKIISAILDDDPAAAKRLLQTDPALATQLIEKPKLHNSGIVHWIYAGDTALHLAAAGYSIKIVELLLASGADPNAATNHRKSTPLHYATDGFITGPAWDPAKQVRTIRLLVEAGADIHAPDKNGATPLHRAVRTRSVAAVQYLLDAGADPTIKNKPGSTPFHLAVQNTGRGGSGSDEAKAAQHEIIQAFLRRGVSVRLEDNNGKSILQWATNPAIRGTLSGRSA